MLWDDTFMSTPSDLSKGYIGDDEIRNTKVATRERLDLEHDFMAGTRPYHRAGKCSVLYIGTTTEINNLGTISKGSIAYDTLLQAVKAYNGTSWQILTPAHSELAGLSADDHTQYLHLDKTSQTLEANLTVNDSALIGGHKLSAEGGRLNAFVLRNSPEKELTFTTSKYIQRPDDGTSFEDEGFVVGDVILTTATLNPGPFTIVDVTDTYLEVIETVVDEVIDAIVYVEQRRFDKPIAEGYSTGVEYTANRDCFIIVSNPSYGILIYTGPTSPPTLRAGYTSYVYCPVRRGHLWKVTAPGGGTPTIYRMDIY